MAHMQPPPPLGVARPEPLPLPWERADDGLGWKIVGGLAVLTAAVGAVYLISEAVSAKGSAKQAAPGLAPAPPARAAAPAARAAAPAAAAPRAPAARAPSRGSSGGGGRDVAEEQRQAADAAARQAQLRQGAAEQAAFDAQDAAASAAPPAMHEATSRMVEGSSRPDETDPSATSPANAGEAIRDIFQGALLS